MHHTLLCIIQGLLCRWWGGNNHPLRVEIPFLGQRLETSYPFLSVSSHLPPKTAGRRAWTESVPNYWLKREPKTSETLARCMETRIAISKFGIVQEVESCTHFSWFCKNYLDSVLTNVRSKIWRRKEKVFETGRKGRSGTGGNVCVVGRYSPGSRWSSFTIVSTRLALLERWLWGVSWQIKTFGKYTTELI